MNAASAMMCVLKAWELSPHLLETTVLPLELEALAILQPVLVLGGGEMDVTARNINWIKRPRHLPIFNTPRVIPVTPRVIGGRQRHTAQGGFPV